MSIYPYYSRGGFYSPMEQSIGRMFNEMMHRMERPFLWVQPYWLDLPDFQQCNIGNVLGETINDKERFAVEVDVTQFRPEELSVKLQDRELVVEGHHEEKRDHLGTIERHFVRRYTIPDDAHLHTLESHLSDKGVLSICAKKTSAINEPLSRNVPIQLVPREAKKIDGTNQK